jgi:uncharacterized LabA/DUF88 family protein
MSTFAVVDTKNLQFCISKQFGNRKFDYSKIEAKKKIARGLKSNTINFCTYLKKIGFDIRFLDKEKTNLTPYLIIDLVTYYSNYDKVIIGSSSRDLVPAIEYLISRGVDVQVIACGIPTEIRRIVTSFKEITEDELSPE